MPDAPHRTRFSLSYDDEHRAGTVARSLANEVGEIDDGRSRARLEREGAAVTVEIDAADLVALRAAMNTWLSLATVAERAAEIGGRP